jgi:hypothetical protein
MKLICPGCGAIASAESWDNDTACRSTLQVITTMPGPVVKSCLGYLSLFRPGTRALSWKKAFRLATEIKELTEKGFISLQGRVDRTCSPGIWARAMEQMVEQRASLSLPMPNHNYLKKVAYDLADQADGQTEKKQHTTAAARPRKPAPDRSVADPALDPLEKVRRAWDAEHGAPSAEPDYSLLAGVVKGMD